MSRASQDKVINEYGNYLLNFCQASGLRIMNGRIGSDSGIGKFTCVTENGCSVVDYVLRRPDLMKYFKSFTVEDPNICFDLCEINFSFCRSKYNDKEVYDDAFQHIEYTYKWDMDGKEGFIQTLRSEIIQDRLNRITNALQLVESQTDIDSNLSCFMT